MKKVLMIAFHFPPQSGSSGQLRTLKYCRYLPEFGWQPAVLTPSPRAYDAVDERGLASIPKGLQTISSFALDTQKHLSIGGRYPKALALPDRWVSWIFGGILAGLRAVFENRIDVLYSTFPVASAVVIGLGLQRLTGLPWVLDLRDPMKQDDYPEDPFTRRVWGWIERACIRRVSRVVFTAKSTRQIYLDRYPRLLSTEKCILISNGFDEADFCNLDIPAPAPVPSNRPVRLVHSGLIYPVERDPRPMFRAVSRLKKDGRLSASKVQMIFRAPGSEDLYRKLLAENDIADLILLEPHTTYAQALQECADSDGLLLFQAANSDMQVPAKAYEYLRLGRPILALTSHTGDTAALLHEAEGATIVSLASEDEIYAGLPAFVEAVRAGSHPLPNRDNVRRYTREAQAGQLAEVMNGLVACTPSIASQKTASVASLGSNAALGK